jgi:hypothetical protein
MRLFIAPWTSTGHNLGSIIDGLCPMSNENAQPATAILQGAPVAANYCSGSDAFKS